MVISVVLGFGLGWLVCKGVVLLFRRANRRKKMCIRDRI